MSTDRFMGFLIGKFPGYSGMMAFCFFFFSTFAYAEPQQVLVEKGEKIFQEICTACHTVGGGVLVGPDLKGVTRRRDLAWLRRFILAPDQMLNEKDPIALALFEEYGIPMPSFGLTEEQVEAIIAYLGAGEPAPAGIPSLYIPTLLIGVLAIVALTFTGLIAGTKRVEVRL